jgi:DNA repair ATPase RecN
LHPPACAQELEDRAEEAREETQARARALLGSRLEAGEPLSQLVREVAAELGARKRPIYELALEMQGEMRGIKPRPQAESGSREKST